MKKKYFVILNSIIVHKESSLVDAVKRASFINESEELNYQTVYTIIKKQGYYFKVIPFIYNEDMPAANMYLTIQEVEL